MLKQRDKSRAIPTGRDRLDQATPCTRPSPCLAVSLHSRQMPSSGPHVMRRRPPLRCARYLPLLPRPVRRG